ncbi:MAG: hypothetical protein CVV02_17890 [Firmicutes bacterium HGW-Firmicutes-7]|nr:MAG: hypothetical protein CVV02_17890 [Firmicutes bacterium HGW-Firmicutes-7]
MNQKKNANGNVNKENKGGEKANPTIDTYTTKPKVRDAEYSRELSEVPEGYAQRKDKEDNQDEENFDF